MSRSAPFGTLDKFLQCACCVTALQVDASQGVQAQSISVFHIARERGLKIIPVLNKVEHPSSSSLPFLITYQIDLPAAQPELMAAQMESTFGIDPADIIKISAKTGAGVEEVLKAVIERIPPPSGQTTDPVKAFLFDSLSVNGFLSRALVDYHRRYDRYRGVISLISVQGGILRKGDFTTASMLPN